MKIIPLDQVEKNKVDMVGAVGAWKQLPIGSEDGAPVYSYRVFTVITPLINLTTKQD